MLWEILGYNESIFGCDGHQSVVFFFNLLNWNMGGILDQSYGKQAKWVLWLVNNEENGSGSYDVMLLLLNIKHLFSTVIIYKHIVVASNSFLNYIFGLSKTPQTSGRSLKFFKFHRKETIWQKDLTKCWLS